MDKRIAYRITEVCVQIPFDQIKRGDKIKLCEPNGMVVSTDIAESDSYQRPDGSMVFDIKN